MEKKPVRKAQAEAQEVVQHETEPVVVQRRRAIFFEVSLIITLLIFSILAYFANNTHYFAFDLVITQTLQGYSQPWFARLMQIISWPGFLPQGIFITALVILFLYGVNLHLEARSALIAALGVNLINLLVKYSIQRPRPAENIVNVFRVLESYSFPSGHVMFYTGFFGFLWFLAFALLKPSWSRRALLVFLGLLVILVGVSRVYLGQHWASDVMGAYILGGIVLAVVIAHYQNRKAHQDGAP